jgi:hypothetical protein
MPELGVDTDDPEVGGEVGRAGCKVYAATADPSS